MLCTVCNVKPADPKLEGSFNRPVCEECFASAQVDMEDELLDLESTLGSEE